MLGIESMGHCEKVSKQNITFMFEELRISILRLPLPRLPKSPFQLLRNPSPKQPNPREPRRTRPPPYLHRHTFTNGKEGHCDKKDKDNTRNITPDMKNKLTSERRHAWRT